jgi:YfiH family protein
MTSEIDVLYVLGAQLLVEENDVHASPHLRARIAAAAAVVRELTPRAVVLAGGHCVGIRYTNDKVLPNANLSAEAAVLARSYPSEASVMRDALSHALCSSGVSPAPPMMLEELSTSTLENAAVAPLVLARLHLGPAEPPLVVGLVTNIFHMHRAVALFIAALHMAGFRVCVATPAGGSRAVDANVVLVPLLAEVWAMRCTSLAPHVDVRALVARVEAARLIGVAAQTDLASTHLQLTQAVLSGGSESDVFALLAPFAPTSVVCAALSAVCNVRHGFLTRFGGASAGDIAALDFSSKTPADVRQVNRALVARAFGLLSPALLKTVAEVHGTNVVCVDATFVSGSVQADGMVTRTRGVALGILTADCCPVLLATRSGDAIGALHAGWRGACAGIVESGVRALLSIAAPGTTAADVIACTGPCIERSSYQVGADVRDAWLARYGALGASAFFEDDANSAGYFLFDVPGAVHAALRACGVETVDRNAVDTFVDSRFFSYRRARATGERNGNQLSVIALSE